MQFTFTTVQSNILLESLDITLKQLGLKGLYTIVELVDAIQKPISATEEVRLYEFTEQQLAALNEVLDITVKAVGLQGGAAKLLEIVQVLQNPAQLEAATEAAE